MGRAPCCDKSNVKKGPWSPEEDAMLKDFIDKHGTGGNWISLPQKAGLRRCGKSCRLRWLNYLRPNIKHGKFSDDEDRIICNLFASIGSRWSIIAANLPGRTDNDIKNYWNTKLKKKLLGMVPHSYSSSSFSNITTAGSVLQSQQHRGLSANRLGRNKDSEFGYGGGGGGNHGDQQIGNLESFFYNEGDKNDHHNLLYSSRDIANGFSSSVGSISSSFDSNFLYGETTSLDYGIERINQQISSTSSSCEAFGFYQHNANDYPC
ncbi:hypothetical protein Goshw_005233 [Gossypium schwendimanii]|uniref:Uncharacterized protein n=1 Tax=Gossypium schwendimanii TaxID=34291 RepID=A0A7J9KQH9_GOSSC|nr:hypothetical protein [Gossypium schwendimanii]